MDNRVDRASYRNKKAIILLLEECLPERSDSVNEVFMLGET